MAELVAERAVSLERHSSALGAWEMATGAPHPALRGHVVSYCGYWERTAAPLRRREVPISRVVLIISFGDLIRVHATPQRSFVAALTDTPALTEHDGRQHGIQVDLTPLGAFAVLGVPMRQLSNAVVDFPALLGSAGAELVDRLAHAGGWAERFALLDAVLAERAACGPAASPEVAWAWRRLRDSHGSVPISALRAEVGWSHRHLVARFREQVGMSPKSVARVLRFERAIAELAGGRGALADLALRCGYYDQAHLNREFRDLAGCSPTQYLAAQLPDSGGVTA